MVNQSPHRARGVKVLKAVSSPIRLQILNLLFDKSALSYSELMGQLKLNPCRDAGRFAYHLKFMLKADLVEADVETKKYYLTDLGKMVLDVADRVEKKAVKPRGMLVRTSHLTVEEFDPNKIANSLIKEAKVPPELAQKAAKEAEKRLVKSKTKYLTASLIREVVNAILVEKGYEEYRHKLTRVGMPVHEVAASLEKRETSDVDFTSTISRAGKTVLSEYTLLNIFPRDISDAHLSGAIHIDHLGTWILKPDEVFHDLRFFFQHGINLQNPLQHSMPPPTDFKSALSIAFNVLLHSSKEINCSQTFNYFNVFLSPFVENAERSKIKERLRLLILNLNQHANVTLGLELSLSALAAEKQAIGPHGKTTGKYADFVQESQLLGQLVLEVFAEECSLKPLVNPKLVIKINSQVLHDPVASATMFKAHELAVEKGALYFANMTSKETENSAFSSSGVKLACEITGDWETDTLRTGCLGSVTINLPRIVQECENDKNKLFELIKERYELAARALVIKHNALKQFGKSSLPFLLKSSSGDTYFRLENCTKLINLAGFKEAIESFTNKSVSTEESRQFTAELVTNLLSFKQKVSRKYGKRLYPVVLCNSEASERLAQLDVEKYGVAKVKFSGTRDKPYYSTAKRFRVKAAEVLAIPQGLLEMAQSLKGLRMGGSLEILELEASEVKPQSLMDLSLRLIQSKTAEFFTYNRSICFCNNCQKGWLDKLHKCPGCGSMSALANFDRYTTT